MGDTKSYRYNGCYGYLGEDSMFWTKKECCVLSALRKLEVGSKPTKNTAKLFKWLLPLHTFADAMYYSHFWDIYPPEGTGRSMFFSIVKELSAAVREKEHNDWYLKTRDYAKDMCTIWGTHFNLAEVEGVVGELYTNAGKQRNTVLFNRVLEYIAIVLGFPCEEFREWVEKVCVQAASNSNSVELQEGYTPLVNTAAVEMLNINRDNSMSTKEASIVFNNMALTSEQLVNLLPDRSFQAIENMRTFLEIMLYNAKTEMPAGALCSLEVNPKNGEYIIKYSAAYIAFWESHYHIELEPVVKSGLKVSGKSIRRGKSKVKSTVKSAEVSPAVEEASPCGSIADGVDKLVNKGVNESAVKAKDPNSSVATESANENAAVVNELIRSSVKKYTKGVVPTGEESTQSVAKKTTKKSITANEAKPKKAAMSKKSGGEKATSDETTKELISYGVLDLYATGTPWSYEELVYLVEHQTEDVTTEFIKAKPGAKRSKTDILKKLVQLKQWGITESSMLIRW